MEIGLDPAMPTYSGGLGVLAGDTLRSAADLKLPMVAVTLLHRRGYFLQKLGRDGGQDEEPMPWPIQDFLEPMPQRVFLNLEGRQVMVRAWRKIIAGIKGSTVPVYLLDTAIEENGEWDRSLTDTLYGGDARYRLAQEAVLGIGGVRMLRALGYSGINRYHMNEGHSSLLVLELLEEERLRHGRREVLPEDISSVHHQCVFTTHTPVPAGHDQFPMELVHSLLGDGQVFRLTELFCCEGRLNMTYLAMNASHYINGVAKRHGEVARHMFAKYTIESITNGVHAVTWAAPPFKALFDRNIPGWKEDNFSLRYAAGIPRDEIWRAHQEAKDALIREVNRRTGSGMDANAFTLGFARRATAYKRPSLLFRDREALRALAAEGGLQLIFAGKAHPMDREGKDLIRELYGFREALGDGIRMAYLENYDMDLGRLMTSGADLWLNTPLPPLEASGTSGMKAALNGVPSLSILDGWWLEGHIEGVTGWSIGNGANGHDEPRDDAKDAVSLYEKLGEVILPLFRRNRQGYVDIMRQAIALNGSFFNTQRMVQQYVVNAYYV